MRHFILSLNIWIRSPKITFCEFLSSVSMNMNNFCEFWFCCKWALVLYFVVRFKLQCLLQYEKKLKHQGFVKQSWTLIFFFKKNGLTFSVSPLFYLNDISTHLQERRWYVAKQWQRWNIFWSVSTPQLSKIVWHSDTVSWVIKMIFTPGLTQFRSFVNTFFLANVTSSSLAKNLFVSQILLKILKLSTTEPSDDHLTTK